MSTKPVDTAAEMPRDIASMKIKWDDTNMKSSYANVCNVTSTREEVVMLFGMNQAWNRGQKEVTIQLTNRIVVSPYAAKRLSLLLGGVVKEYESRFGTLNIDAAGRAGVAAKRYPVRATGPSGPPVMSSVEPEIHQSFAQSEVTRLSARRAYEQAWAQFAGEQTPEQFCHNWLVIQSHVVGGVADGVVILLKPATGAFTPVAFLAESSAERSLLANVTERALREGRGVVALRSVPGESAPRYQLAYPVRIDGRVQGVVGLDIDPRPEPRVQAAIRELQWGSGWLELLLRRHVDPRQSERQRLKVALDLVAALLEHSQFQESASAFATQLASQLGCDRVSLGVLEGKRVRLRAVSHSDRKSTRLN